MNLNQFDHQPFFYLKFVKSLLLTLLFLLTIVIWGLGTILWSFSNGNVFLKTFLMVALYGGLFVIWNVRYYTEKHLVKTFSQVLSSLLILGITAFNTSIVLAEFLITSEAIQFFIWTVLIVSSLILPQQLYNTRKLTAGDFNQFPPFKIIQKRIVFLLPAYDESNSIETVISSIRQQFPQASILVIDNNSSDGTGRLAEKQGATVIYEKRQGKGYAVITGFTYLLKQDYDAIIMMDADNTYYAQDAVKLIQVASLGGYGVVIGSRIIGKRKKNALSSINLIGNIFLTFTANILYKTDYSDICTGYWLFRPRTIDILLKTKINSTGFGLEAEMVTILAHNGIMTKGLPIIYGNRVGNTKLRPFRDGIRILFVLLRYFLNSKQFRQDRLIMKHNLKVQQDRPTDL